MTEIDRVHAEVWYASGPFNQPPMVMKLTKRGSKYHINWPSHKFAELIGELDTCSGNLSITYVSLLGNCEELVTTLDNKKYIRKFVTLSKTDTRNFGTKLRDCILWFRMALLYFVSSVLTQHGRATESSRKV